LLRARAASTGAQFASKMPVEASLLSEAARSSHTPLQMATRVIRKALVSLQHKYVTLELHAVRISYGAKKALVYLQESGASKLLAMAAESKDPTLQRIAFLLQEVRTKLKEVEPLALKTKHRFEQLRGRLTAAREKTSQGEKMGVAHSLETALQTPEFLALEAEYILEHRQLEQSSQLAKHTISMVGDLN
jgi:hypothetical protein